MQALITDLNVDSKVNLDLQNIRNLNTNQNSTSNVSFSDFLNSAKMETEKSDVKTEEVSKKENVEDKKVNKKDDSSEKSSENKVDEKTENVEKVESTEKEESKETEKESKLIEKSDERKDLKLDDKLNAVEIKNDKNRKVEKKSDSKSKKVSVEKKTEIKTNTSEKKVDSIEKKVSKSVAKVKDSDENKSDKQKILEKDFYKLNQLVEEKTEPEDLEEIASYVPVETNEIQQNDFEVAKNDDVEINTDNFAVTDKETDEFSSNIKSEKTRFLDKDEKIVVKDLRTEVEEESVKKSTKDFTTEVHFDNENTATITMDMNAQNTEANVLSLNSQVAGSDGSNFQAMLNNQIQANIPEFVKTGSIILKDNNQGSINLVLHPDDLGNVKISLSLDGKSVSGHIIVNTKEALEVFKDNAQDLREAFIKNGFDAANFDVSYNNNSNSNQNNSFENQFNGNEFVARQIYNGEASADSGILEKDELNSNFSEYSINIVA